MKFEYSYISHLNFHCVVCGQADYGDILGVEAGVQLPEAWNVPDQHGNVLGGETKKIFQVLVAPDQQGNVLWK